MRKMMLIGILCLIVPFGIATTVGITFAALDVYKTIDLGLTSYSSITVGALSKRELIVSDFFIWVNQESCKGTITLQHMGSGETIVKSYSFNSHSQYMERMSERFVVDLKRGEWTINHQRTSGEGELEIKSTFCGSQEWDIGGITGLWIVAFVALIMGGVIIRDEKDKEKLGSYSTYSSYKPYSPPKPYRPSNTYSDLDGQVVLESPSVLRVGNITFCLKCGRVIEPGHYCR